MLYFFSLYRKVYSPPYSNSTLGISKKEKCTTHVGHVEDIELTPWKSKLFSQIFGVPPPS